MFKQYSIKISLRSLTILIGIFHLIFLTFRIYEIAMDLYVLEEVIDFSHLTYIILITALQLVILISLFTGAVKGQHVCLLPWLCFTAPTFSIATVYGTLYLATGDLLQNVINFTFICLFWTSWYIVLRHSLDLKSAARLTPFRSYKYSANFKEVNNLL